MRYFTRKLELVSDILRAIIGHIYSYILKNILFKIFIHSGMVYWIQGFATRGVRESKFNLSY